MTYYSMYPLFQECLSLHGIPFFIQETFRFELAKAEGYGGGRNHRLGLFQLKSAWVGDTVDGSEIRRSPVEVGR